MLFVLRRACCDEHAALHVFNMLYVTELCLILFGLVTSSPSGFDEVRLSMIGFVIIII